MAIVATNLSSVANGFMSGDLSARARTMSGTASTTSRRVLSEGPGMEDFGRARQAFEDDLEM